METKSEKIWPLIFKMDIASINLNNPVNGWQYIKIGCLFACSSAGYKLLSVSK